MPDIGVPELLLILAVVLLLFGPGRLPEVGAALGRAMREFRWVDRIALIGEFNDWNSSSHFLRQTYNDEDWHISLELEAGRSYRFRYLVDGWEWGNDDHADGYEPNPYGGVDSVVRT